MARKSNKPKRMTRKVVQETESVPYAPKLDVKPDLDTDGWDDSGLTVRQRSFVDAVVGPAGGNATKAAELAGYAAENREALKVTAARLLSNANVAKAISLALAKRRLTPEWVKSRLADIANADMNNFMSKNERGEIVPDFEKAVALGALGQIKEYDAERGKIKLHDPTPALNTLLKLFGLLVERHDHTTGGKPIKAAVHEAMEKVLTNPEALAAADALAAKLYDDDEQQTTEPGTATGDSSPGAP